MKYKIQTGNTYTDSADTRGWIVGDFIKHKFGLRHTADIEIKWSDHKSGESRLTWVTAETRTTIAILVKGKFSIEFRNKTAVLENPGDYAMWGLGVDHKWTAIEDSTLITIRWPSRLMY